MPVRLAHASLTTQLKYVRSYNEMSLRANAGQQAHALAEKDGRAIVALRGDLVLSAALRSIPMPFTLRIAEPCGGRLPHVCSAVLLLQDLAFLLMFLVGVLAIVASLGRLQVEGEQSRIYFEISAIASTCH
eukprot:6187755-Pleurochrysis_carterae.AAC.2